MCSSFEVAWQSYIYQMRNIIMTTIPQLNPPLNEFLYLHVPSTGPGDLHSCTLKFNLQGAGDDLKFEIYRYNLYTGILSVALSLLETLHCSNLKKLFLWCGFLSKCWILVDHNYQSLGYGLYPIKYDVHRKLLYNTHSTAHGHTKC